MVNFYCNGVQNKWAIGNKSFCASSLVGNIITDINSLLNIMNPI